MNAFAKGHALIVGVGRYAFNPDLNLPETAADARAIAAVLSEEQRGSYAAERVQLLDDVHATREAVLAALDNLGAQTEPEDAVFLFYSGHGEYGRDRRTYHLTTHDTVIDFDRLGPGQLEAYVVDGTGVSETELLERIRAIRARQVFIFFNSCYSGALTPATLDAGATTATSGATLPSMTAAAILVTGKGRAVITSCQENQVSIVGDGPLSIFGQALVDGLRGSSVPNRDGVITLYDLYVHLYTSVGAASRPYVERLRQSVRSRFEGDQQVPELTLLKNSGKLAIALHPNNAGTQAVAPVTASDPRAHVRELDGATSQRADRLVLRGEHSLASLKDIETALGTYIDSKIADSAIVQSSAAMSPTDAHAKSKLSDLQLQQHMEARLRPNDLDDLVAALGSYVDFDVDTTKLGRTFTARLRRILEHCQARGQREALIAALLDVHGRILGGASEQQSWYVWAREQDEKWTTAS